MNVKTVKNFTEEEITSEVKSVYEGFTQEEIERLGEECIRGMAIRRLERRERRNDPNYVPETVELTDEEVQAYLQQYPTWDALYEATKVEDMPFSEFRRASHALTIQDEEWGVLLR